MPSSFKRAGKLLVWTLRGGVRGSRPSAGSAELLSMVCARVVGMGRGGQVLWGGRDLPPYHSEKRAPAGHASCGPRAAGVCAVSVMRYGRNTQYRHDVWGS